MIAWAAPRKSATALMLIRASGRRISHFGFGHMPKDAGALAALG
jgi:hypothetical protein